MANTPTHPPIHPNGKRTPSVVSVPFVSSPSNTGDAFRLEEWLRDAGVTPSKIGSTAKALRENDFDDASLLGRITADDLKECGITSVGIRKCILESVRGDTNVEDVKSASPIMSPPRVRRISSFSPMGSPPPLMEVPPGAALDPNFVEYQVLSCCGSKDFELTRCVAAGQNGIVFAARCLRKGLPRPMKLFALKLVFNFGLSTAATRNTFENEFNVLSRLPPHLNITRFWTQFVDEIPDAALEHLPRFAKEQAVYRASTGSLVRRKAQFVVLDYHPETFRHHRALFPVPLPYAACLRFSMDLLKAVSHLQRHHTAHLDLKPDNILVATDGRIVLCDFGTAVQFESAEMSLPYTPSMSIGGNVMHLAPEVLNEHERLRRMGPAAKGAISYFAQEVWAVGVLIHTMVFGVHPWPDYPNDCGGAGFIQYNPDLLPPYPPDYPEVFRDTVLHMLEAEPSERILVDDALAAFALMPQPPSLPSSSPGIEEEVSGVTDGAEARKMTLAVRYVSGAATTLVVDDSTTVSSLLRRALGTFFPTGDMSSMMGEHHVLYAGRFLPPDGPLGSIGLEHESCLHVVRRPAPLSGLDTPVLSSAIASSSPMLGAPVVTPRAGPTAFSRPAVSSPLSAETRQSPSGDPTEPSTVRGEGTGAGTPARRLFSPPAPPREVRPTDIDTTLVPFRTSDAPADVEFEEEGLTTATNGKWVTVMADMPGISCGRFEWEIELLEARPGAGLALGVADLTTFYPTMQNLGVGEGSWCYSKTGQASIGGTTGFSDYGATFSHGSRVCLVLDMDAGTLRFVKDGEDQGIATCGGLKGKVLTPGIVMGTNKGGKRTKVTVTRSAYFPSPSASLSTRIPFRVISHFNTRTVGSQSITISNSQRTASTSGMWASMLVNPGEVDADITVMLLLVDDAKPGAGLGIGLADVDIFDFKRHVLGVSAGSWCYSKTGQASAGDGFRDYGSKFTSGDRVCMVFNRVEGSLKFYKNNEDQGVAFSEGLKGKRLMPSVVMGSSNGGKVTTVTLSSSLDMLPPSAREGQVAPRLFV